MQKLRVRLPLILLCFVLLGLFVPSAVRANEIDFNCSGQVSCNGSIAFSGGNFSSTGTGITVTETVGPVALMGLSFKLLFDTGGAKTISLTSGSIVLSGVIQSSSVSPGSGNAVLALHVLWNSLPAAASAFLGTPTGIDSTSIIYLGTTTSGGAVTNIGISILSTPEPTSLALLGSGLVMVGGFLRRRWRK